MDGKTVKVGSVVHYMKNDKPQSGEVKGIAVITGELDLGTSWHKIPELKKGESKSMYFMDSYTSLTSDQIFSSADELKKSLFD